MPWGKDCSRVTAGIPAILFESARSTIILYLLTYLPAKTEKTKMKATRGVSKAACAMTIK